MVSVVKELKHRSIPSYKLAKHLTKILNQHITLNNHYNVTDSINLANDLTKLKVHENNKMISFDIKDPYVNIPIDEILNIIKSKLLENNNNDNNNTQITHRILSLLKVTMPQNYFIFQHKIYQPEQGVSVGSPISSLIAEIFLQHYEDIHIKQLLDTKNTALFT